MEQCAALCWGTAARRSVKADGDLIAVRDPDVAAGLDHIPQCIAGMPQMTPPTRVTQGESCSNAAAAGRLSQWSHTGGW